MLVAANKIDALDDPTRLERLEARAGALGLPFFAISAVTGRGVPALLEAAWPYIAAARPRRCSIGDDDERARAWA